MKRIPILPVLCALAVLPACGLPSNSSPSTFPVKAPSVVPQQVVGRSLYFVRDERLSPLEVYFSGPPPAQVLLDMLRQAPPAAGDSSLWQASDVLKLVSVRDSVCTVEVGQSLQVPDPFQLLLKVGQVVLTLTGSGACAEVGFIYSGSLPSYVSSLPLDLSGYLMGPQFEPLVEQ